MIPCLLPAGADHCVKREGAKERMWVSLMESFFEIDGADEDLGENLPSKGPGVKFRGRVLPSSWFKLTMLGVVLVRCWRRMREEEEEADDEEWLLSPSRDDDKAEEEVGIVCGGETITTSLLTYWGGRKASETTSLLVVA